MLLEENYSEISTRDGAIKNQSRIVLSESFVQLEASEITKGLAGSDGLIMFNYNFWLCSVINICVLLLK